MLIPSLRRIRKVEADNKKAPREIWRNPRGIIIITYGLRTGNEHLGGDNNSSSLLSRMTYKQIQAISNIVDAVEDWKRELVTEDDLAEKFLEGYKSLKENKKVEKKE